jgi:nicotinamidase/pyrazinamidase
MTAMADYDGTTGLIVVDVQNDFADPKGSLYVREGERVVPVANREVARARAGGVLVAYSADWHPQSTPHFAKDGGIWPVHCVQGTWGAEFHPDLDVAGPVVRKGSGGEDGYSAFSVRDPHSGRRRGTELERILRQHGVERLVIVGLATDYCVKETALDASRIGFAATVLLEGVRAVDLEAGDGDRALAEVQAAGIALE